MENVVATKLNSLENLYYLYLLLGAWGTEEFRKIDGPLEAMRDQFTGMVHDGSLVTVLEDAKAAAEGMNPGLPGAWLHVIAPVWKLAHGPLPEDERKNLMLMLTEMSIKMTHA